MHVPLFMIPTSHREKTIIGKLNHYASNHCCLFVVFFFSPLKFEGVCQMRVRASNSTQRDPHTAADTTTDELFTRPLVSSRFWLLFGSIHLHSHEHICLHSVDVKVILKWFISTQFFMPQRGACGITTYQIVGTSKPTHHCFFSFQCYDPKNLLMNQQTQGIQFHISCLHRFKKYIKNTKEERQSYKSESSTLL